jgi:hypothetical protein
MKYLNWSDNVCTIGWTSIHGVMNADDMEWMGKMHPAGHFTPTFFSRWSWNHTVTPERIREHCGDESRGFYFTFPEDERGQALLTALKFKGMKGERYMSARYEWKRMREVWANTGGYKRP